MFQVGEASVIRWMRRHREEGTVAPLPMGGRRRGLIDKTGSTVSLTRPFARAPAARVPTELVPRNHGTVTTVIGALTSRGLTALMAMDGGTDREVFVAYVRWVLLPELRPSDIVLLDNVGAHKGPRVRDLIEGALANLWILPPYSPDLNPIEECWSKVKGFLKTAKARTREALELALAMAAECVSPSDARGWLKLADYVNIQPERSAL